MSLSRNNKIWSVAESLLGRLTKKRNASAREQKPTKLLIDQLEERQLLSLTVAGTENLLVNPSWQDIRGDIAVDSNDSGDVVVAWTAADRLANPDYVEGDPASSKYLTDDNGDYVEDLNIYARYLTDEVQIITLPDECVPGTTLSESSTTSTGSFSLLYNAYETQRLSIYESSVERTSSDVYTTSNSLSCFYLGFYAEGELTWILYKYDSTLLPGDNAANLQTTIRNIKGGEYSGVEVNAYSETDFDITFYDSDKATWAGYDLADVRVSNNYYEDITALIDKVSSVSFEVEDLKKCSDFQKLILKDTFGDNYLTTISKMIKTSGRSSVIKQLKIARDSVSDSLTSGIVTTVKEVQKVTVYNSKGNEVGISVSSNPYTTAKNIQNAFNNASTENGKLYAPITRGYEYNEKTHRFEYTSEPTRAYSADESYGSMQAEIKSVEVVVEPVLDANGEAISNQFKITFTGASGMQNQDSLIVSSATYATKVNKTLIYTDVVVKNARTGEYEYVGVNPTGQDYSVDTATLTVKESSSVFRVNAVETAEYELDEDGDIILDRWGDPVISGTGRTDQSKPDIAMSGDGSFVIVWENENSEGVSSYNQTDVFARRFNLQGYIAQPGEGGYDSNYYISFYSNGTEDGASDIYDVNTDTVPVQGVAPIADEFRVNASVNGKQTDPTVAGDLDGNFIVSWTYLAQDNSYFGGVYGRQFNNDAQPTTGDIVFASGQVGTNYYGPSYASMSDDGFAVVLWNYKSDLYQSALEPQSAVFIVDNELVANNAYGSNVSFDYNGRYTLSYTQEEEDGVAGTEWLPTTDSYVSVYKIVENEIEEDTNAFTKSNVKTTTDTNADDDEEEGGTGTTTYVGQRQMSERYTSEVVVDAVLANTITVGDQGKPASGMDADGDLFVAYQGFGMDIHSISTAAQEKMYSTQYDDLYIQLTWDDFQDNNLVYVNKAFDRGGKLSYESKNEDLADFIKLALGWGYESTEYGDVLVEDGAEPVYVMRNYDCIDADSYIRFFLSVAQKEKATDEQVARLDAILETLLSPLRNNGNDINYVAYGQTIYGGTTTGGDDDETNAADDATTDSGTFVTDPNAISGVVSSYRNGSNACFYISFPLEYVATAKLTLNIGRLTDNDRYETNEDTAETVDIDISACYDSETGYLTDFEQLIETVNTALNGLEMCDGDTAAFVVRYVDSEEIDFYKGTIGEIGVNVDEFSYTYSSEAEGSQYTGTRNISLFGALQITAQNTLHDTPLYLDVDYDASSFKMKDQALTTVDYARIASSLYVERQGSIGNSQTNPDVAMTPSGDVAVVWAMSSVKNAETRSDLYPSIGNSLKDSYSHIYLRNFVETTDTAGPIVVNAALPNGETIQEGETVTSAVKDVVVSFNENMMTIGSGSDLYNVRHAVDNPANWTLLRDGVAVDGAIESITFGMNASRDLARATLDENGSYVDEINNSDLAYGSNHWEAVIHLADGYELKDGNYSLVCSAMVQDVARNALYSQGYAEDESSAGYNGKDWTLNFSVIRLNEALAFEYSASFPRESYISVDPVHGEEVIGDPATDPIEKAKVTGDTLSQVTRSSIEDTTSDYGANTAQAVATDANGDYVVVWTEKTESYADESEVFFITDNSGSYLDANGNKVTKSKKDAQAIAQTTKTVTETVYARTYRALYVLNAEGNRVQVVQEDSASQPIVVYQSTCSYSVYTDVTGTVSPKSSSKTMKATEYKKITGDVFLGGTDTMGQTLTEGETDPRQASVSMDDKGDFVVVWDMKTYGEYEDGSRDVYIAKYAFNGGQMAINGNAEKPTRVNIENSYDQQYASVAMDADGDVVVVWESYKQDGSGWGIYGRRFGTNGLSYGYANTIQVIQLDGSINIQGDVLTIGVYNEETNEYVYADAKLAVEMKTNAANIEEAIISTGLFAPEDLIVAVSSDNSISIEFTGSKTGAYVDQLTVETNNSKLKAYISTRQRGVDGVEFLVNETTDNNQRFASIGMQRDGSFVVSWTSWGQDGDSPTESNIYARQFASNHIVSTSVASVEEMTASSDLDKVITTENIELHEVTGGQGYDSVCMITVGGTGTGGDDEDNATDDEGDDTDASSMGTGSLLTTRQHVLTAAHVVCSDDGTPLDPTEEDIYCTFETASGVITIKVAEIYVHETYAGDPTADQVDLAVLKLEQPAPASLTGYELYTGSSELGQTITFVGYGIYGDVQDTNLGTTDEEDDTTQAGVKHEGQNVYELTGADFDNAGNPNTLIYDFDDGTYANDYLGNYCGVRNLGLGSKEAITAQGDSGSPSFIGGQIAGVCSYGSDFSTDSDEEVGGMILPGNYQVDVRVSSYVDWINSVILSSSGNEFLVNTDEASTITAASTDDEEEEEEEEESEVSYWQVGSQMWSNVAMDNNGNFVITWTGYNQDGNGDSLTGSSNNGLGGVFMRAFVVGEAEEEEEEGGDDETNATTTTTSSSAATLTGSAVQIVNQYTANDQIHSQVAMTGSGNFVVVYESYQDPSNIASSDLVDNFGIYARRYALTTTEETVKTTDDDDTEVTKTVTHDIVSVGAEFKISRSDPFDLGADGDQLGGSVAVDPNGDMVFVWSDLSYQADPTGENSNIYSVVMTRSIALPEDTTPPYVVRANAVYRNSEGGASQVSLYANNVAFSSGNGPTAMVYSFSEYMYSAQMFADIKTGVFEQGGTEGEKGGYNGLYCYSDATTAENKNIKSVLNYGNWTLTCNGKDVTSTYVQDIVYGYNASIYVTDYLRSQGLDPEDYITVTDSAYKTNSYELVIVYKREMSDGAYVLTLNGSVTDSTGKSSSNSLDGNYDGVGAGKDSFSVRWTVGSVAVTADDDVVPVKDQQAFTSEIAGNANPVVVSNSSGYIIVSEEQKLIEYSSGSGSDDDDTTNATTDTDTDTDKDVKSGYFKTVVVDGTTYRVESDIVMRTFNADGSPSGVETRVNAYATGNQMDPDIALTEGGSYVVVWNGESDVALNGVCARFYPGGKYQTQQVQVAGVRGTRCWDAHVTINDATGLVLITWMQGSADEANPVNEIYGRFYDLNGNVKSAAFKLVSASEAGNAETSVSSFDDNTYSYSNYSIASYYDEETEAIKYAVTWFTKETIRENNRVSTTEEIYQKSIAAVRTESGNYKFVDSKATRVNETTTNSQTMPQIAMIKETGDYYIVWSSNQEIGEGDNIYIRKFNKYGEAISFMGTTGESLVNSYVKDIQATPSVAANEDGVIVAWKSYGEEEFNYNSKLKVEQRDYGVAVRVFNAAGEPIYITGDIYDEDGSLIEKEVGEVLDADQGEFIINSTVENDQFDPSVTMFDWELSSESGLMAPKFVVVWTGPNPHAGEETEESENDDDDDDNATNDDTSDDTSDGNKFVGAFTVYYKLVASGSVVSNDSEPIISSKIKGLRFGVDAATSTSNGFYRPTDVLVEQAVANGLAAPTADFAYTISGTDGDDDVVVTANKDGGIASVTVNGESVAIPTTATTIYFVGGKGEDSILYKTVGVETAAYDSQAAKAVFVGAKTFIASEIENVDVEGGLAEVAVEVATSEDVVELAPGTVAVKTAKGGRFNATGVADVVATGGSKATVVMTGSSGDDALYANAAYAILAGEDYSLSAASFANVQIIAGAGSDVAEVVGQTNAVVSEGGVIASNANSTIIAVGFENVALQGSGSVTVYGTRGSDSVYASSEGSKVVFSTGNVANISGFTTETYDGMDGKDSAVLIADAGNNYFDSFENKAVLTNGKTTKTFTNFSNVAMFGSDDEDVESTLTATIRDTARDDAFAAYDDTATLDVDGVNFIKVVGADSVVVKREIGKGVDTIEQGDSIDFLFATENWDFE